MTQKIIAWLGGMGIVVGVVGALFLFGYTKGYDAREAADAATQKRADDAWQKKLDDANARGDKLAADLVTSRANVRTVTQTVVKEIPKVTTVYKEKAGAPSIALPGAVITWGFVRLWNDASDPTVKHDVSVAAGVLAGSPAEADLVKSGVTIGGILSNHVANAGQYADCRDQLNALIDWHEANPTQKSPQ